jgi:hypothetical protein
MPLVITLFRAFGRSILVSKTSEDEFDSCDSEDESNLSLEYTDSECDDDDNSFGRTPIRPENSENLKRLAGFSDQKYYSPPKRIKEKIKEIIKKYPDDFIATPNGNISPAKSPLIKKIRINLNDLDTHEREVAEELYNIYK